MTTSTPTSAHRAPSMRRDLHSTVRAAMPVRIRPAAYAVAGVLVAGSHLLDVLVTGWTR